MVEGLSQVACDVEPECWSLAEATGTVGKLIMAARSGCRRARFDGLSSGGEVTRGASRCDRGVEAPVLAS